MNRLLLCGTAPDHVHHRERRHRWQRSAGAVTGIVLQRTDVLLRDQVDTPSCLGQACIAAVDAQTPVGAPPGSGIGVWRDAHRRQGMIEAVDMGTRPEYALASLVERGWDNRHANEELDPKERGLKAPPAGDTLSDELTAADRDHRIASYRLHGCDDLDDALAARVGIVGCFGTRQAFETLKPDEVATGTHLGGSNNGHAMRIAGRVVIAGLRRYLITNSWGKFWGGCHVGDLWLPGYFLADEEVVDDAWDLIAIKLLPGKK